MAVRYSVSLPDHLVARVAGRKLPLSLLLQNAIIRYLDQVDAGQTPGEDLTPEERLQRIERILGI